MLPYSMKLFNGDDTNEQQNISSQGEIKLETKPSLTARFD